ncbi:hypothetical protein [Tessaracoccus palaemonis]|uniref:Uncharacterized protein n=1 Tax=Tessaracoccus palaemonis TaxID=2829499 RepID=A0ABX8SLM3_9ACTN|nr:hypothetical protein [Tessaracoccus palaemonis]QXT63784.1 hypothetical protein KDB89_04745 [Tessaracoccus palaemonis]
MTQSISIDFSPVIRAVDNVGLELSQNINQVDARVGMVAQDLRLTTDQLIALRSEFDAFVQQAGRTAAVQQSETRVVNLKADLDRSYGHHAVVRRTSVGLLQAFDVGNVSRAVTAQISEELMLQTPRYWLAPALVALAAWANHDQEMAERSVREAYARDRSKTSLLFTIILRRQGRLEASTRWLKHYLEAQDPGRLGREFTVIFEAASFNAFGPAAQQLMTRRLADWVTQLSASDDIVQQQIARWLGELQSQTEQLDPAGYPNLADLSPTDWPVLVNQLEVASSLPVMIDKYGSIARHETSLPTALEDLMDDLVDRLVTEYDAEELPLRREVLYHESVIEEGGDIALARRRADELQKALDETTDAISLQTQTAIAPELLGASVQTQRIAIGASQAHLLTAIGRYCAAYRQSALEHLRLDFTDQHSNYAREYAFGGASFSTELPEDAGVARLREAWVRTMSSHLEKARFDNSWYGGKAILVLGIAIVVGLFNVAFGIAAALIGAGVVWFFAEEAKKASKAAIVALEDARDKAAEVSIAKYRNALAERVDALDLYRSLDRQEADLISLIETWPTAQRTDQEVSA